MKIFTHTSLWTILKIWIDVHTIDTSVIDSIFTMVDDFEKKYSRFITWNYLHQLNKNKQAIIEPELKTMISIAKKLNTLSNGHFDITVLPYLENIWYGIATSEEQEIHWMENIIIHNEQIILKNNISIELGGIGKGYMIDMIFHNLSAHFSQFIINFWGDIRVSGTHEFSLEDPINTSKSLWNIQLHNNSLAGSASNKRKTDKWHHLIDINKWTPENEKLAVYVTHNIASLADGFATTLFVSPIETALNILKKVNGLEGMIIMKNGDMYQSEGFELQQ